MPAAILLAAGFSRRLGRPKQTVVFEGETLLARAARIAQEAGLAPVFAVVQPDQVVPAGTIRVENREAEEGMAASIRAGVRAAAAVGATGVLLMTCDQIAVTPAHLRLLYDDSAHPAGSHYAGKNGIPAYFPASAFADLLQLTGDTGARDLMRTANAVPTEALAFDIDTEADLHAAMGAANT